MTTAIGPEDPYGTLSRVATQYGDGEAAVDELVDAAVSAGHLAALVALAATGCRECFCRPGECYAKGTR